MPTCILLVEPSQLVFARYELQLQPTSWKAHLKASLRLLHACKIITRGESKTVDCTYIVHLTWPSSKSRLPQWYGWGWPLKLKKYFSRPYRATTYLQEIACFCKETNLVLKPVGHLQHEVNNRKADMNSPKTQGQRSPKRNMRLHNKQQTFFVHRITSKFSVIFCLSFLYSGNERSVTVAGNRILSNLRALHDLQTSFAFVLNSHTLFEVKWSQSLLGTDSSTSTDRSQVREWADEPNIKQLKAPSTLCTV